MFRILFKYLEYSIQSIHLFTYPDSPESRRNGFGRLVVDGYYVQLVDHDYYAWPDADDWHVLWVVDDVHVQMVHVQVDGSYSCTGEFYLIYC